MLAYSIIVLETAKVDLRKRLQQIETGSKELDVDKRVVDQVTNDLMEKINDIDVAVRILKEGK